MDYSYLSDCRVLPRWQQDDNYSFASHIIVTFAKKMRNVAVTDADIDRKYAELQKEYNFVSGQNDDQKYEHNVKYQIPRVL